jgi:hypothetical protein
MVKTSSQHRERQMVLEKNHATDSTVDLTTKIITRIPTQMLTSHPWRIRMVIQPLNVAKLISK